jgi:hypothetical protein
MPDLVHDHDPETLDANVEQIGPRPLFPRYTVDYNGLIAVLIKAVQELDTRLAALENA